MKFIDKLETPLPDYLTWMISILFSFGLFGILLLKFHVLQPDLDEHILISEGMFNEWRVPAHPLFYFFVQLFSFFTKKLSWEVNAAFVVFSLAQLAKIKFSKDLIEDVFQYKMGFWSFGALILLQVCISFSIFGTDFIIGQISPNYFHNGTLMISMPFAIKLLHEGYRFQKEGGRNGIKKMILFGLLVALSKPSFLFCFIPVFPAYILVTRGMSRELLGSLQVSTLLSFMIIGQSYYLKFNPPSYVQSFKVLVLPFHQFGTLPGHLTMFFGGLFLIFIALALNFELIRNRLFQWIFLMQLLGYFIAIIFVDSIDGIYFSNMTWQASAVLYLLLIISAGSIFKPSSNQNFVWRKVIFSLALLANSGYSLYYLYLAVGLRTLFF
jgi:hypothetical protein